MSARHSGATAIAPRFGHYGDAVAVVGRLAAEGHDAPRPQYPAELPEGGRQVGQVVEHRVAEDQVERVVLERELRGLAGHGLDRHLQLGRRALEPAEHAGRDVGGHRLPHHARTKQVEREVPRARADLERALVPARLVTQRLAELAGHLRLADAVVVDPPLRVVVLGGEVVVADVEVPYALGALHGRQEGST